MARDTETETPAANQSKRPGLNRLSSDLRQGQHTARPKGQKHVVGGGTAGRIHARVPSSKALSKNHATASTNKLSRARQASDSPEHDAAPSVSATTHRRTTSSDLKLALPLQPVTSAASTAAASAFKRNRSNVDVQQKKLKSPTALKRSSSNPNVPRLKPALGKVHFNLGGGGDDDQDDDDLDGGALGEELRLSGEIVPLEGEWVDASNSASPLQSRRGSANTTPTRSARRTESRPSSPPTAEQASGPQPPNPPPRRSQTLEFIYTSATPGPDETFGPAPGQNRYVAASLGRETTSHQQYITSRLLQPTSSFGAPPKMSTENASARPLPAVMRQQSPSRRDSSSTLSHSSGLDAPDRPGSSSGKDGLTSRFVGNHSQGSASASRVGSFLNTTTSLGLGGMPRSASNALGQRPLYAPNTGYLPQESGRDGAQGRQGTADDTGSVTDDDDMFTANRQTADTTMAPQMRSEGYAAPKRHNRTQQKLELQRTMSTMEPNHTHPAINMGLGRMAVGPAAIGAVTSSCDPRVGRLLERTGTEYLTMRRYQNPIARSLTRLAQLPGARQNRQIPQAGSAASRRGPAPGVVAGTLPSAMGVEGPGADRAAGSNQSIRSLREVRDPGVAAFINAQASSGTGAAGVASEPPTPTRRRLSTRASTVMTINGDSNGLGDVYEEGARPPPLQQHQPHHVDGTSRLSGASLVDGEDDAGTLALLRNMWDKNLDLSTSQD